MGIAAEQLGSIFELFVQLDRSLERNQAGLGIGLTLVRRLVELHGGSVVAESAGIGRGSRFVVRLPVAAPPSRAAGAAAARRRRAAAPRVLVVDDNRDSAESLASLLELAGHELHLAYDGPEAIAAGRARTGRTRSCSTSACPASTATRPAGGSASCGREYDPLIVALTGWGQEDDRRRSTEAGFDAHLVKPVDVEALAAAAGRRLTLSRARRDFGQTTPMPISEPDLLQALQARRRSRDRTRPGRVQATEEPPRRRRRRRLRRRARLSGQVAAREPAPAADRGGAQRRRRRQRQRHRQLQGRRPRGAARRAAAAERQEHRRRRLRQGRRRQEHDRGQPGARPRRRGRHRSASSMPTSTGRASR